MEIIVEDNHSNWWSNVRIWGGEHMTVPDHIGEELILRGLVRKVELKVEPKVEPESRIEPIGKLGKHDKHAEKED